jgi:hypothetical protein
MGKKKFDVDRPLPRFDPVRDRPERPIDPARIEPGDIVLLKAYCMVSEVQGGGAGGGAVETLVVEDLIRGGSFPVDGADLLKSLASADQYDKDNQLKTSRTNIAKILITSGGEPITVAWVTNDGTQRVLRGHFKSFADMFGYSYCIDLEVAKKNLELEAKNRTLPEMEREKPDSIIREVNHKTLEYLILGGTCYYATKPIR